MRRAVRKRAAGVLLPCYCLGAATALSGSPSSPWNQKGWQAPTRGVGSRYTGPHRPPPKKETWSKWEYLSFEKVPPQEHQVGPQEDLAALEGLVAASSDSQSSPLAPDELDRAISALEEYTQPERQARLKGVLEKRTINSVAVFESPSNVNNIWATLRTLDSFGLQHAHIIADPVRYPKQGRLKTMCTAMGSQKWLTLTAHKSPEEAVKKLKADGYRIVASEVGPGAVPVGEVDWSQKTAFVIGNEAEGISPEMKALCDELFVIPMSGFAESFNMSVACAITLAVIQQSGGLKSGDMSEEEKKLVYLRWLMLSVRDGEGVLKKFGIQLPHSLRLKNLPGIAGYSTIKT